MKGKKLAKKQLSTTSTKESTTSKVINLSSSRHSHPMANAADSYTQELIRGSVPGPSSSRARVAPLTDDEIGWFCCVICTERRLVLDRFRAGSSGLDARCAHDFCIGCVVRYIEGCVAEGAVPVPCPAPDCRDGVVMHPEACKKLVDIDVFDAWCVALCERAVGSARARCPYRDCGEIVVLDAADAVASEVECPTCSRAYCLQCEEPWDDRHGGGGDNGDDGQGGCVLTRLASMNNWTRCPSCRAMIDKIDGCERIMCRCGTTFCYLCGSPVSNNGCMCSFGLEETALTLQNAGFECKSGVSMDKC